MALKWKIFLIVLTNFCNCEVLRNALSVIHNHWNLKEVTLVYRNTPTLLGWPPFDVPRIQNLTSTGVNVAFLDLTRGEMLRHVAIKMFPTPITFFLALPIDDIKDTLRLLLHPSSGHLHRLHERLEILISVPKQDYVAPLLSDLYIPIYCQVYFIVLPPSWRPSQLPRLFEVYHIPSYSRRNLPIALTMLLVRPGFSVPCKHEELWERRRDLQGIQLKAETRHLPPMVIVDNTSAAGATSEMKVSGFIPEIWRELESLMNFSTSYRESVDSEFGALSADGQWSGLMGMLHRREIDVAIAGLTLTNERVKNADFTHVVYQNSYRIYFRKNDNTMSLNSLSLMTPWQILFTVLASVLVSTLAQVIALRYVSETEITGHTPTAETVFFYNFYAFCQQGTNWGSGLRSTSGRMNLWIVYFCGLVVFNTYSATMISRLAVSSKNMPFESMEELIRSEKYQLLMAKGTADLEVLKAILKNFGLNISSYLARDQPETRAEGIERVCRGNFAFWTTFEPSSVVHDSQYSCTPLSLVTPYVDSLSMALVKGLPYHQMFNYFLQKMMEAGTLASVNNRWFPVADEGPNEPSSIELHQAVPLFIWITLGLVTSVALLIAELYTFKRIQSD